MQVADVEQSDCAPISSSCSTQEGKAKGFASFPPSSPFSLPPITPISNPPIIPQSPCHLRFAQMTQHQQRAREAKFLGGDEGQLSLTDVSPHKDLMGQGACSFVAYFNAQLAKRGSPSISPMVFFILTLRAKTIHSRKRISKPFIAVRNLCLSRTKTGRNDSQRRGARAGGAQGAKASE